jgi:hypothetical protein
MSLFKIRPWYFPGGIEENQVRIAIQDHLNTKQKSFIAVWAVAYMFQKNYT